MVTSDWFRVYVYDTDVAGVVHHSQYLRYLEMGRIEFLRQMNQPYAAFQAKGIGFVPVDIHIAYRHPLRLDDQFCVTTRILTVKNASFRIEQQVLRMTPLDQLNTPDAPPPTTLCVTATLRLACVKEPEFRIVPLPESIRTSWSVCGDDH